jgi:hypothetical protein
MEGLNWVEFDINHGRAELGRNLILIMEGLNYVEFDINHGRAELGGI